VARSRNHCCSVNTTMHSVCIVELHVTVICTKIHEIAFMAVYVAANNQKLLGRHVKCRYFCALVTKFGFCDRFSWKSTVPNFIEIRPLGAALLICEHTDGRTDRYEDGHAEGNRRFSKLHERA
jgi:hypothetical protein